MNLDEAVRLAGLSAGTRRELLLARSGMPAGAAPFAELDARVLAEELARTRRTIEEIRLQLPDAEARRVALRLAPVPAVPVAPVAEPAPVPAQKTMEEEPARIDEMMRCAALQAASQIDLDTLAERVVDRLGGREFGEQEAQG